MIVTHQPANFPVESATLRTMIENVWCSLVGYSVALVTEKVVAVIRSCVDYVQERLTFLDEIELLHATKLVILVTLQASDVENADQHKTQYLQVEQLSEQVLNPANLEGMLSCLSRLRDHLGLQTA